MPSRKVGASALAGALSVILVWGLNSFAMPDGGPEISGEIASAITTILSFLTAYVVTEPA